VIGDTLPAATTPHLVDAVPIRAMLESMTAKNWRAQRDKLLASLLHDMI